MTRSHAQTISHVIGEDGTLSLKLVSGTVRIVGVDGDEARVRVRMELPEGHDPSEFIEVSHLERELRVHIGDGRRGGLATMFMRSTPDADLEVEVPRGAALRLAGVSAELEVRGIDGDQEYVTVSGDLSIEAGSGLVTVQSVSGDVRIQGSRLAVEATSTSGDVEVAADHIEHLRLRSVSGDASVAGVLQSDAEHRAESVSGDLRIEPRNGIALTMSSFSGAAYSELSHREESRGGRRVLVIGDGAADITFRSMSGDAEIVAPPGADPDPRGRQRIDLSTRDRVRAERDVIHAERDRLRAERDAIRDQAQAAREMAREAAHAAREQVREEGRRLRLQAKAFRTAGRGIGGRRATDLGQNTDFSSGTATAAATATTSDQLDVLRALERGEIDVDEAARLLEATGDA